MTQIREPEDPLFPTLTEVCLPAATRTMSALWRCGLGLVLFAAVLHGIAIVVLGHMVERDIKTIRDAGDAVAPIELRGEPIPYTENAAVIYMQAFAQLPDSSDDGEIADEKTLRNILGQDLAPAREGYSPQLIDASRALIRKYQAALKLIDEAGHMPKCKYPVSWEDGLSLQLNHIPPLRQACRMLTVRSLLYALDGRMSDAMRSVESTLRVSESLADEPILISALNRYAMVNQTTVALRDVASRGRVSYSDAERMFGMLGAVDMDRGFVSALKGERAFGLATMRYIQQTGPEATAGMPDTEGTALRMLRIMGSYPWRPCLYADELVYLKLVDESIRELSAPWRELRRTGTIDRLDQQERRLPSYAVLSRLLVPGYSKMTQVRDEAKAEIIGSQVFLALLAYKDRFGSYPSDLQHAQEKLGWSLGSDPFSGADFEYRREGAGFVLYSVGPNLESDRNGREDHRDFPGSDSDDIVWRMAH